MNSQSLPANRRSKLGFTLVEILVSTTLVVAIMVLMLGVVDQTQRLYLRSRSKTTQFQSARTAFDNMARRLSQATLNTYWRAQEITIGAEKADYLFRRNAELQFISAPTERFLSAGQSPIANLNEPIDENYPTHALFFHAPLGYTERTATSGGTAVRQFRTLDSLLCAIGYFIEFGDDVDRPSFIEDLTPPYPTRNRYRLMEMIVPSERFNIYSRPVDTDLHADTRIFDERAYGSTSTNADFYYAGLVNTARRPIDPWIRPLWMKEAFKRVQEKGKSRFSYTRPIAENIIALIVLPKVPEKDRLNYNFNPPTPDPKSLELAPYYQYDSWRVLSGKTESHPTTKKLIDNRSRDNLLPPIVQLTMVAIDEPSAARMNLDMSGKPKWTKDLFKFVQTEEDYQNDIKALEKAIRDDKAHPNVNYRIFTTDVIIRGSKWSRDPSTY